MTLGAVAPAQAQAQQTGGAETNMDGYRYDPGPDLPACTRGQVRLQISLPPGTYDSGSAVPFQVRLSNISSKACSVTALQPPSGLATQLIYVRIFDSEHREILIPNRFPGIMIRMLPRSLAPHRGFAYKCPWDGRIWSTAVGGPAAKLGGITAPPGSYEAIAVIANPAMETGPLRFVLKRAS